MRLSLRLGALFGLVPVFAGQALAGPLFGFEAADPQVFQRSGEMTTVTVVFAVPCHPHGPYLVETPEGWTPAEDAPEGEETEASAETDEDAAKPYLLLREAEGAPSPVRGLHTIIGNRFELRGYRVERLSGNHAGDSAWFDVVSWRLLPDSQIWTSVKDKHKVILVAEPSAEPISYAPETEPDPNRFRPRVYAEDFACGYDAAGKPRTHTKGTRIRIPTRSWDTDGTEGEADSTEKAAK
ncbi:MAG: hypothetical protein AAFR17_18375 [Pseudomonadota bacterium]